MKVAIIGANGGVGRILGRKLVELGHEAFGFIRDESQAAVHHENGVSPVIADLVETTEEEYAEKFSEMDAVIFSAGAGGKSVELIDQIDGNGLKKIVRAAEKAGVERFLHVSAFMDAGRGNDVSPTFEHYMKTKRDTDVIVANSSLNWIILRPGTLVDRPGTGNITIGAALNYGEVPREDVAATLAALLETPNSIKKILELTEGDQPLSKAVVNAIV